MREAAVKGWGVAELARQAKVGRPTIYGWRDGPGKPQAAKVNAVADALGIPRDEALRLAGIITAPPGSQEKEEEPRPPRRLSRQLQEEMRDEVGDEMASYLIAHYEHLVSGRTAPAEDGRRPGSSGTDRRTAG